MIARMKRLAGWTGALLLGLPVALLAHMGTYGNEHLVGGSQHGLLIEVGFVLAALAGLLALAATLLSSRSAQSGSMLAAKVSAYLPTCLPLALCSLAWFVAIERCESPTLGFDLLVPVWIALLSFFAYRGARAIVRAFATLAVAWFAPARAARPGLTNLRFAYTAPLVASRGYIRRRFTRPPPLLP
jgi:hypothetical protein